MFDGALLNVSKVLISLHFINFVANEFDFGKLLSLIALLSVVFSLQIVKVSDAYKKRTVFIWPLSFILALTFIGLSFATEFWLVLTLVIIYSFFGKLLDPLLANVAVDAAWSSPNTWISRDLFLNIGRGVTLITFAAVVALFGLQTAIVVLAGMFVCFPFLLMYKGVYNNKLILRKHSL
jgi:hypothetical protein